MTLRHRPQLYIASSWRNRFQPALVTTIRNMGALDVYDYREPSRGGRGFHWSDIDPDYEAWGGDEFVGALDHPIARDGFNVDMNALRACDACLLVLPSGRSAHLELGFCRGAGKPTAVYIPNYDVPELMYRMADHIFTREVDVLDWTIGLLAPGKSQPMGGTPTITEVE